MLVDRLEALRQVMIDSGRASGRMASATKGSERENFIREFLEKVFPPTYRFGTGDVIGARTTDLGVVEYNNTGQLDIVVELPFYPSLSLPGSGNTRLYLAEGVATVIEVKSDVKSQWNEVLRTADRVATVRRDPEDVFMTMGCADIEEIQFFVVGYNGWKRAETIENKIRGLPIAGVLVIDPGIYVGVVGDRDGYKARGAAALWCFIAALVDAMSTIGSAKPQLANYLLTYDRAEILAETLKRKNGIDVTPELLRSNFADELEEFLVSYEVAWGQPSKK